MLCQGKVFEGSSSRRCKKPASVNSFFCWQHGEEAEYKREELKRQKSDEGKQAIYELLARVDLSISQKEKNNDER